MDKKYAYVAFVSDERYILGMKVMRESMKRVSTRYPLVAAVPFDASVTLIDALKNNKFEYVVLDKTNFILNKSDFKGMLNYFYSFYRLSILKLIQYDKIIYLDSDLLFISNSDDLFDKPHFSSVISGKCSHPNWKDLCSGLIVIEPSISFYNDVINSYEEARLFRFSENGHTMICDQDLFAVYKNFYWRNHKELHLQETYDCLDHEIDLVIHTLGIKYKDLHIVHMASSPKIWFRKNITIFKNIFSALFRGQYNKAKAYLYYYALIRYVSAKH